MEGRERDEVEEYVDLRSIGSSEAVWHLFAFPISKKYPAVYALRVHLKEQQQVVFDEGCEASAVEVERDTELTAFFKHNKEQAKEAESEEENEVENDPEEDTTFCGVMPNNHHDHNLDHGDSMTYVDFPKKYVWDKKSKTWRKRKQASDTIGRVHSVHPVAGDVFYLRILLHHNHCIGKTSFEDLMTINGEKKDSYQDVCRELGLLQDDLEWDQVLTEGAVTQMCPALRELFITILLFCSPGNPAELFENHFLEWADDFKKKAGKKGIVLTEEQQRTLVLLDIQARLESREASLGQFQLPSPTVEELREVDVFHSTVPVVIREELDFEIMDMKEIVIKRKSQFTDEQTSIFTTVMAAVESREPLQMFIDARGGCGKTFVLNALLAAVRSLEPGGCVALAMGTTGIASNLLQLGCTYHSRLKAPLTPTEDSILSITGQSTLAQLVRMTRLLIIDESTMLHRYQLEGMDRTLRDIMSDDRPFGGKVVILSGNQINFLLLSIVAIHVCSIIQCVGTVERDGQTRHGLTDQIIQFIHLLVGGGEDGPALQPLGVRDVPL